MSQGWHTSTPAVILTITQRTISSSKFCQMVQIYCTNTLWGYAISSNRVLDDTVFSCLMPGTRLRVFANCRSSSRDSRYDVCWRKIILCTLEELISSALYPAPGIHAAPMSSAYWASFPCRSYSGTRVEDWMLLFWQVIIQNWLKHDRATYSLGKT